MKIHMKSGKALAIFLTAALAAVSCKDDDKNTMDYHAYAVFPKFVNPATHGGGEIKLSVLSNRYETKAIETEVTYTDTKKSELVAPNGSVIKPGDTFKISGINETQVYKFNSADTTEHSLRFRFRNADGLDFVQEAKLRVKGHYKFSAVPAAGTVEVNKPIDVAFVYKAFDSTPQTCEIVSFAITDDAMKATIAGGKDKAELAADKPLRIVDTGAEKREDILPLAGTFAYKPSTVGTHEVSVTVKNEFGFEEKGLFSVVVTP